MLCYGTEFYTAQTEQLMDATPLILFFTLTAIYALKSHKVWGPETSNGAPAQKSGMPWRGRPSFDQQGEVGGNSYLSAKTYPTEITKQHFEQMNYIGYA